MTKERVSRVVFCVLAACIFCTCGMEDYIYLFPVETVTVRLTEQATIQLPPSVSSESLYFTNFTIFYRIYISDIPESSAITTREQMQNINTTLYNDYTAIYPSTTGNTSSTTVNTSVGTLFSNRNYYELELEGQNIDSILGGSSPGQTLVLDFPNNGIPYLTLGGSGQIRLFRSTGNSSFSPRPNRLFVNTTQLNDANNATSTINADVVNKKEIIDRHAYVSLYIVKVGRDANFANIYSTPTFIGILRLPE